MKEQDDKIPDYVLKWLRNLSMIIRNCTKDPRSFKSLFLQTALSFQSMNRQVAVWYFNNKRSDELIAKTILENEWGFDRHEQKIKK